MLKKLIISSLLFCALLVCQANAATIAFDDPYANSIVTHEFTNSQSFSDGGLTFTNNGSYLYIWDATSPNSNGTNNLIFAGFNSGEYLAITRTGGGTFDVLKIDMSISFYDYNTTETVYINGSPITIGQGIQTYTLNLYGITELDITGVSSNTGYWLMDNMNISTSAVPIPGALLLFGPGLAGLGLLRRRCGK